MPTYVYPDNAVLTEIAQVKTPTLTMTDPAFELMPIVEVDASKVIWDQMDDYVGLQQVRGINGAPPKVARTGSKTYEMKPGVYGEYEVITEDEITNRRQLGTFGTPINITDLVAKKQDKLLSRRIDRIRQIIWTLLTTGTFSTTNLDGEVLHTDTFALQTFTAAITWATVATATPLANFRAVQLLGAGLGVSFGAGAQAFMNQTTFNSMVSNLNANDLAGRRTNGLNVLTALNLTEINAVLLGEGLPTIRIHDGIYKTDAGVVTRFIGNNKVVVVGVRNPGETIGEYQMTRNANNDNAAPGAYMEVVEPDKIPRQPQVHDGHNGGPAIFFPGSIVIMTV